MKLTREKLEKLIIEELEQMQQLKEEELPLDKQVEAAKKLAVSIKSQLDGLTKDPTMQKRIVDMIASEYAD